jgi:hypothetical protein
MDRVLLSFLVGLTTYFVLNVSEHPEKFLQKGGFFQSGGCNDGYPECFEISSDAKNIIDYLKSNNKCGTNEYNQLGLIYSPIFCLEISLGNNSTHTIEVEKSKNEVRKLTSLFPGLTINITINSFINDAISKSNALLTKLNASEDILNKNKLVLENSKNNLIVLIENLQKMS